MAQEQTPFERACALLEDMMRVPEQAGDRAQRLMERLPSISPAPAERRLLVLTDTRRLV